MFYNNTWGTVCDNHFDEEEIKVICRMLGYESGYIHILYQIHFFKLTV